MFPFDQSPFNLAQGVQTLFRITNLTKSGKAFISRQSKTGGFFVTLCYTCSMANHKPGECFAVQFVWKLPEGDFLRAVFEAEVLDLVPAAEKYVVRLKKLLAGRQESAEGVKRPETGLSQPHWQMVGRIVGRKISLAYEVEDGRPLNLRLATLTGEHNFFFRFPD